MTSSVSPQAYYPLAHALATDRSPVYVLPPPTDPTIAPDLARLKAARAAEVAAHPSTSKQIFVLGTRNSKLAMVQTELVKRELERRWPGTEIRIFGMTTSGDNNQSQPLYLLGGKALWTKELEVVMLEGAVDAIVHSMKDVPTTFPPGCELGAVLEREDPSDALVVKAGLDYRSLEEFPDGSVIGTSSVRRVAQLRRKFPKLKFADVRGNLQTRLRKLDDPTSTYTALILASAGLIRVGLASRITTPVTSPALYHAVGQGAICVEIREGDARAAQLVGSLECWKTGWTTRCERSMLRVLEGGCSVPVGCETKLVEMNPHTNALSNGTGCPVPRLTSPYDPHTATLTLTGTITSLAGTSSVLATLTRVVHSIADCELLGADIAQELIAGGGRVILEELGKHVKEVGGEEGKEVPFESNRGMDIPAANGRGATAVPVSVMGPMSPKSPKSPHHERTVFKDGEVCLRPAGW